MHTDRNTIYLKRQSALTDILQYWKHTHPKNEDANAQRVQSAFTDNFHIYVILEARCVYSGAAILEACKSKELVQFVMG